MFPSLSVLLPAGGLSLFHGFAQEIGEFLRLALGAQQEEDGVVPGDGPHQPVPLAGIHRHADGVGHAGVALYHNKVPRKIYRADGFQKDKVDVQGGGLWLLLYRSGVVIAPGGGEGLDEPQLLNIPGNGGLGGVKPRLGKIALQLLLGGDGVVLDDAENLFLPLAFHGGVNLSV